jgi:hypothetical protein
MLVVDLFSGSGGATQAFVDRGHKVVRLDLAADRKHGITPDVQADVRFLPIRCKPDFVWASPPCTEFSFARGARPGNIDQGMEGIAAACDAIAELAPTYWAIENVHGAVRFLPSPTKRVGAWVLWGRFPPFDAKVPRKWQMAGAKQIPRRNQKWGGVGYTRGNAHSRARVPYALSLALCMALERDIA